MATDSKSNENALEEAFRLIEKGNEHVEGMEHWKATDSYSHAHGILQRLAEEAAAAAAPYSANNNTASAKMRDEQAKIAALYRHQSEEYLQRARGSFISALQQVNDDDDQTIDANQDAPKEGNDNKKQQISSDGSSMSDEECFYRMKLFGRLFAKEPADPKTMHEQESSLEARLQELNASLPAAFKTEKERMRDLNRGLARLGLSLFPDTSADAAEFEQRGGGRLFGLGDAAVPKSESEQVDWIIAQAKDEVAVAGGPTGTTSDSTLAEAAAAGTLDIKPDSCGDNRLDDEDDDDSVDFSALDEDADLTPAICKDLHIKLVAAQVSLSELVALFDVDTDNDAAIEFEQARGKKMLQDVRLLLRQVTEKWAAC